ncbi:MAG: flagellar basal-body rod protein FlgF [Parvibaculaceae bacterium]
MDTGLNVALSAQVALQERLDTIAGNVANANTVGFRAEETTFETHLARAGSDTVAFAKPGETYTSRRAGELVKTDNALDIAVQGDAWLAIQTPAGVAYTRDGRFRMAQTGELQTLNGQGVLDVGGAPILLDPNGGPPQIARDGMITQGKQQLGAVGLFRIDERAKLTRVENSAVIPDRPAQAELDFTRSGVVQGFVEKSNVNPVLEMSRLVMVSRAFDAVSNSINQAEDTKRQSVRELGASA